MSKDKSKKEDRSERKEKKEKRAEADGAVKKSKKEKKVKKELPEDTTTALLNRLENEKPGSDAIDADGDVIVGDADASDITTPVGALVPFANPLADEKQTKKVLKAVKKGKTL